MKKTLLLAGIATFFALNANAQYYPNSTYYPQSSQPIYHKQHKHMLQKSQYHNNMIHKSTWNIRPVIGMDYSYALVDSEAKFWGENYNSALNDEYNSFAIAGGIKINKNFGVELFYQQSSDEKGKYGYLLPDPLFGIDEIGLKYKAYGIDFIGYIPFHEKFDLIGTIGVAKYEMDTTYSEKYVSINGFEHYKTNKNDDNIGFRIGAGIQANVTDNISVRLIARYQHTGLNTSFYDNECNLDLNHTIDLTAGLRFYFL